MNDIEALYWRAIELELRGGIDSAFQNDTITYVLGNTHKMKDKGKTYLFSTLYLDVNENENKKHVLTLSITAQERVGKYTVDFFLSILGIVGIPPLSFAIEIDGHEFHEKTKEQVAHDKERERALIASGLIIIRYTGSEVFNYWGECASDTISTIVNYISQTWDIENV